jgi:DNA adenine methylase
MAYLGGKSKSAEHILEVLNNPVFDSYDYIEPFCGYCHILRRVINKKSYRISDNNKLLVVLLKHIQNTKGEHPVISESEYKELRANPEKDLLKASYAAFCYSYNGKYFGGYVNKYGKREYPKERKRYYDQLHDTKSFNKAIIKYTDYSHYKDVKGKLIYCDPPYEGTTEYHASFDSSKFWNIIRSLSKDNYVFVSEYKAPNDFTCISQKMKRNSIDGRGATRKRVEKLFVHSSHLKDNIISKIINDSSYKCKIKNTTRKMKRTN